MGWLDNWIAELTPSTQPVPIAKPAPRQPKVEIKFVWFQVSAPQDGDQGAVESAYYSVDDGLVTMSDEKGVPTGKQYRLRDGEDARQAAGRLGREAWQKGATSFNRPLGYARPGYA